MDLDDLKKCFSETYHRPAEHLVRAPGRVNLIGEHTDYNDGFVLPIAIVKQVVAALAKRDDRVVTFTSRQMQGTAVVDLDGTIEPSHVAWANYCKGVAAGLIEQGVELCGADVLFDSDIPLGAGLSSSAALEVCTATALLVAADKLGAVEDRQLALLCQKAENQFAGAPCGIMDQSISVMGLPGRALLLDCRTGAAEQIPFDNPDFILLVVDTRVGHDIAEGAYPLRRTQCEEAARLLGVTALRDVDETMIASAAGERELTETQLHRARHVIGEISRTLAGAAALKRDDYRRFGELMYESHASLRDDFEVSCDELDTVVEIARACEGVLGARMTGGGFGGSAIVLLETGKAEKIGRAITAGFKDHFGHACEIFTTRCAAGAGVIE